MGATETTTRWIRLRSALATLLTILMLVLISASTSPNVVAIADVPLPPGALPPGSAHYDIPSGALFVSPSGSDSSDGSINDPMSSLAAAVDGAQSGSTIVLRAGTYHESVILPDSKQLTVQPFPAEAVWFDGTAPLADWQPSARGWVHANWTVQFDSSPTYTRGAPDNTAESWRFVNPAYPLAGHPDQVFLDGVNLRQVGSQDQLMPGTFFVDYEAACLYLGSDPTGHEVRSSNLSSAFVMAGPRSTVRGIGIRGYAPSVPDMGAIYIAPSAANSVMENLLLQNNATTGLSVNASGVQLRHVTSEYNGLLGVQATEADNLTVEGALIRGNNTEHFNPSPAAGGLKITSSRGTAVRDSSFAKNEGVGLWFDESCYGIEVTGSLFTGNAVHGLQAELSAQVLVANNRFVANAASGAEIQNTGSVRIWNNTFSGNLRAVNLVQDNRRAADVGTQGHDSRQAVPDPEVSWLTRDITVRNNAFLRPAAGSPCLLCMADQERKLSGQQLRLSIRGNAWYPALPDGPRAAAIWLAGSAGTLSLPDLASFRAATGQEHPGVELALAAGADEATQLKALTKVLFQVADPMPDDIARLTRLPLGVRLVGSALKDPLLN
ncbi:right-handed parallel beta-helix repeat-containing protein [Arthrobacter sp. UYEF3]|uniref:right-handed parallel beta-helix repeat-containing protein n=1 Tax=Arthrobacter sp. UYEF3 TaxID=1756365 RepID=UPI00339445C1